MRGWKRSGWQMSILGAIGMAIAVGSFYGAVASVRKAAPVRAAHGRPVLRAKVESGGRTTPLGASVAGWVGRVGRMEGKKARTFHVYCTVGDLDGVVLLRPAGRLELHRWIAVARDRSTVDVGDADTAEKVPDVVKRQCPKLPSGVFYEESRLKEGAAVEVLGCLDGDRLRPCNDAADLLTTGDALAHVAEWRSAVLGDALTNAAVGAVALLLLAVIGAKARAAV